MSWNQEELKSIERLRKSISEIKTSVVSNNVLMRDVLMPLKEELSITQKSVNKEMLELRKAVSDHEHVCIQTGPLSVLDNTLRRFEKGKYWLMTTSFCIVMSLLGVVANSFRSEAKAETNIENLQKAVKINNEFSKQNQLKHEVHEEKQEVDMRRIFVSLEKLPNDVFRKIDLSFKAHLDKTTGDNRGSWR